MELAHVYVISNPAMPGLLKVGYTKNMERRIDQLFNTSVPAPFMLEYSVCGDPKLMAAVERHVHEELSYFMPAYNREFIFAPLDEVVASIRYFLADEYCPHREELRHSRLRALVEEGGHHEPGDRLLALGSPGSARLVKKSSGLKGLMDGLPIFAT